MCVCLLVSDGYGNFSHVEDCKRVNGWTKTCPNIPEAQVLNCFIGKFYIFLEWKIRVFLRTSMFAGDFHKQIKKSKFNLFALYSEICSFKRK